jgi:CheY-specific phosphatase CheX
MGIQFFGEFLIDRWVVTRGQLIEALELQDYRNLKFGAVAVQKKYLTEEQVEQINERQKKEDMRFADLAVSMELLSEEHAQEILIYQKNNHLFLGEALLELGHITEDILERELTIFKEEQARYTLEEVLVPEGLVGTEIVQVSVDLTRKMFQRVVGTLIKVGEGVVVAGADGSPEADFHLSVAIPFEGKVPLRYVLSVSSDVAVNIATRILKEDATRESEEVVEDAVKEFCNIVCGNAAAKLAQMGIQADIAPPESLPAVPQPPEGGQAVVFPVRLTEGGLDLRFIVPPA